MGKEHNSDFQIRFGFRQAQALLIQILSKAQNF
jgi:hypothetical protein